MTATIIEPAKFFDDHRDRGRPTPADLGERANHAVISTADPALGELLDDAEYYACMGVGGRRNDCMPAGIVRSAIATVRAIRAVVGWDTAPEEIRRLRRS